MKKLCRKGTVHPSPPIIPDQLSYLPATILTLAAALTPEDREVLAYLISCSATNNNSNYVSPSTTTATYPNKNSNSSPVAIPPQEQKNKKKSKKKKKQTNDKNIDGVRSSGGGEFDHPPIFDCNCFRCYMSYWVRWDSSPNRQLIHEIIDAYEDSLLSPAAGQNNNRNWMRRRERKKKGGSKKNGGSSSGGIDYETDRNDPELGELVRAPEPTVDGGYEEEDERRDDDEEEMAEKGSVRKIVSFLGDKIWNAWG